MLEVQSNGKSYLWQICTPGRGLEVKYDIVPVSSLLRLLIGDKDSASIVQQLYYWLEQGYGEVIDGVRWIYKPVKEWIEEVFPTYTSYQLGKIMKQLNDRGIIRREKLFTKHQIKKGDRFWWQPKNQTYYYSLNYEKLQELAENYQASKTSETPKTSVFSKTQTLSNEEIKDTKDFDCSKNNTDITSIENISKDKSHPHLPCVNEIKENQNSQEEDLSNPEVLQDKENNSFDSASIEQGINAGKIEEKINQNNCTSKIYVQEPVQVEAAVPKPKTKTPKGTQPNRKRRNEAPWKDEEQFKRFYRALIQAVPIVANARSPQGLAQVIIRQLRSGIPHSYWDDFAAGLPIGASTKPEWEIEPGVPYPQFFEYLTEKIIKGNNTQTNEQARNEVFRILDKPRQAKAFWGQFKRTVVNTANQVERDRALGVSNPNTPVWTRERIEPSIEEAAIAGKKIMAVNGVTQAVIESARNPQLESKDYPPVSHLPTSTSQEKSKEVSPPSDPWIEGDEHQPTMREMLAARRVKGFCKPMPKVSQAEVEAEERKQIKPKTNIAQMSLIEINDYLKDPILRAQLTPQLFNSNYELITDELGQIIRVELSEAQIREKRSQSLGG